MGDERQRSRSRVAGDRRRELEVDVGVELPVWDFGDVSTLKSDRGDAVIAF